MTVFSIAAIQFSGDAGDNLDAMGAQVGRVMARFPWIEMIVFGELCAFGPKVGAAQTMPGPAEMYFCGLARKHGIWLAPGSLYEQADGQIFNTAPVINPDGKVVVRHRKLYPFTPYESSIASGDTCTVFDIPDVGRFGLSICYDMWFPETTRAMVWQGAEVIIHPTLTDTVDRDVELAIARANAAVNQCYFLDVNNAGTLGVGRSIAIDPAGTILHQAGAGREVMTFRLDIDLVREVRENGTHGLGQPLKSFRDHQIEFPQYDRASAQSQSLRFLGNLAKPTNLKVDLSE